jgi:hypothetical protein
MSAGMISGSPNRVAKDSGADGEAGFIGFLSWYEVEGS